MAPAPSLAQPGARQEPSINDQLARDFPDAATLPCVLFPPPHCSLLLAAR